MIYQAKNPKCQGSDCRHDGWMKIMGRWYCRWHYEKLAAKSMGDIYG